MSQTGGAGRYNRSFSGLVAGMVVTVLLVVAFVAFRSIFSRDLEIEREPIDYLETVGLLQEEGAEVVYPAELPDGWVATNIDVNPGTTSTFGLTLLTEDEAFVGLRQVPDSVEELLEEYVDEDTQSIEGYAAGASVATAWDGFEDDGGDTAYAAEVGESTVLVYGSASPAELQQVVEALTTEDVPGSSDQVTPNPAP